MVDTFDYADARADAEELIAEFGQASVIRRQTNSGPVYDPAIIETDYACTLVDLDIDESKIDGTIIARGDRMAYVSTAGLSITPDLADKIIIGSEVHAIRNVKPLSPAGTVVLWELIIRK